MEKVQTDQDTDEIDRLLQEIPNATKEDFYGIDPIQSDASPAFEPISGDEVNQISASSNLCGRFNSHAVKCCEINTMDDDKSLPKTPFYQEVNSSNYCRTHTIGAGQNSLNLPDEKFLVSEFEDLSFKDSVPTHSMNPFSKYNPISLSNSFFGDEHSSTYFKKPPGTESVEIPTLPLSTIPNGVYQSNPASEGCTPFINKDDCSIINGIVDGHNDARFLKFNFPNPRDQMQRSVLGDHEELWQSIPVCSTALPVNQGMHTYLLPGLSAEGCELLGSSFRPQFYVDSLPHSYVPYQQLSQSNMVRGDMEPERNYRNHFQYVCLQQLENRCLEGHQYQRRKNSVIGPFPGNTIQPYFHLPIPHQVGQVNQHSYENDNVSNRKTNLDPSLLNKCYGPNGISSRSKVCLISQAQKFPSACDLYFPAISSHGHQTSNIFSKQTCPEKILTRSHGVHSLQSLKCSAVESSQLPGYVDNTKGVLCMDNVNSCRVQCVESLNLDVRGSQVSTPDNSNDKHDLKSSYLKCDSLYDVIGKIHMLTKEQNGCRFLQRVFEKGNQDDVNIIFSEIIDHVVEIMTDPFGNYLVQKLVELCTEEQITHIIHEISHSATQLFRISCNQHGTRVVQKIIGTVKSPEQSSMIVSALKPSIVALIKNNNGSHVAQRCLEYLPPESRKFLFDAAVGNCVELARDPQGCCVLQKCLSALDGEQKSGIISNIISEACELSQDPYGNYVVQYILGQEIPWATAKILDQLEGHYAILSMQKYSSNVVEKCLKIAGERCTNIIRELINDPLFVQIMLDQYGNYVVQSARRECKGAAFLEAAIKPHIPALRISPYGKKVLGACFGK
ncbi:hypothetical protein Cni_G11839 [Canna indica]|uniref:PUM-HD domain-containing protein n=1 Tax=Canna indica TaxID=4628 RepID=A0AAQ3Q9W7_9LILI|nr:hypothetical protein Cni_G11839 [Canna indica]